MNTYKQLFLTASLILAAVFFIGSVNAAPTPETCQNYTWTPVTTDVEGNPITVDSYIIYYGTVSGTYTGSENVGPVTSVSIVDVLPAADGNYVAAITAKHGWDESQYSNEVTVSMVGGVPTRTGLPAAPVSFRLECVTVP